MPASDVPCQELTINQKARFLNEFEQWLVHYLKCNSESSLSRDASRDAVSSFRASMKANADYHSDIAALDVEDGKYHRVLAQIYAALAQ